MSEPIQMSNSRVERYHTCPRSYKLHYVDKIRSTRQSSPLVFGSAVDEALGILLETRDVQLAKTEFNTQMRKWLHTYNVDFLRKDAADELLEECDLMIIDDYSSDPIKHNHMYNWFSLYRRGLLFLDAYVEQILPQVKELHEVQKKIEKTNQYNDSILGYLDFTAMWVDANDNSNDGMRIFDNKTSSSSYSKTKIENSRQLTLYAFATGIMNVSYIVLRKDTNTKGKLRPIQILHYTVTQDDIDRVLLEFDMVLNNVKDDIFPKTDKTWQCRNMFGKPCLYTPICTHGLSVGDCKDLEVKI